MNLTVDSSAQARPSFATIAGNMEEQTPIGGTREAPPLPSSTLSLRAACTERDANEASRPRMQLRREGQSQARGGGAPNLGTRLAGSGREFLAEMSSGPARSHRSPVVPAGGLLIRLHPQLSGLATLAGRPGSARQFAPPVAFPTKHRLRPNEEVLPGV